MTLNGRATSRRFRTSATVSSPCPRRPCPRRRTARGKSLLPLAVLAQLAEQWFRKIGPPASLVGQDRREAAGGEQGHRDEGLHGVKAGGAVVDEREPAVEPLEPAVRESEAHRAQDAFAVLVQGRVELVERGEAAAPRAADRVIQPRRRRLRVALALDGADQLFDLVGSRSCARGAGCRVAPPRAPPAASRSGARDARAAPSACTKAEVHPLCVGANGHGLGHHAVIRADQPPQWHAQPAAPAAEIEMPPPPLGPAVVCSSAW